MCTLGLLLLWGALEGLGRLSSLEGEAFPQAAGPDLFSKQVGLGHCGLRFRSAGQRLQSQYGVYLGTSPRHIWVQSLSGALAVLWVSGYGYGPPSCVRHCPATDGVRQCSAHVLRRRTILTAHRW